MWKRLWAFLTGDNIAPVADLYKTGDQFKRFLYSAELLNQINQQRRYQILSNKSQTQIFIVDTKHSQKVARCYDISYALVIADNLNQNG